MTIEQTIEIPANRRLVLEVPSEIPVGKARIVYFPESETVKQIKPLRSLRGISKGMDTMDAYFERKRTDKALEDSIDESGRYENSRYRK